MSTHIFVDPHRNAAVLMSDEPLYALGPAIVADDPNEAVDALEAFVAALEAPADTMPTIRLMTEWTGFLAALHGLVMGDGGQLVDESGGEAPQLHPDIPGHEVGAGTAADRGPQPEVGAGVNGDIPDVAQPQDAAEAPEGDPLHPADPGPLIVPDEAQEGQEAPVAPSEGEDEGDEDLDLADRLAHVPGGTPAQRGEAECWNCGGEGTVHILGEDQDCGVCHGTGRIPVTA